MRTLITLLRRGWRASLNADLVLPPRVVTSLCLVQIISICVGTFASRWAVGRIHRIGMLESLGGSLSRSFVASDVRQQHWILASARDARVVWLGRLFAEAGDASPSISMPLFMAGLCFTLAVTIIFSYAGLAGLCDGFAC